MSRKPAEVEQMAVAGDDEPGRRGDGGGDDAIVVEVGGGDGSGFTLVANE